MQTASNQRLTTPSRRKTRRVSVGWALLAMWLQVVFAGLHLASSAHALGGPVENEAAIWSICTAEGNILSPERSGNPSKLAEGTLCALCVSGVADYGLLSIAHPIALHVSLPIPYKRVLPEDERAGRKLSPRAGATRAPPLA
nr:hypothetical protein [uncultured Cohaesibacter sp.]